MKPIQMTLVEPCQVKIGDIYVYRSLKPEEHHYLIPMIVDELTYVLRQCEPDNFYTPGIIYTTGLWTATFKTLAENEDIFDKESKFRGLTVYSEIDSDGALRDPRIIPKDSFDDFLKIFTVPNCVTRKYKVICVNDRRNDMWKE